MEVKERLWSADEASAYLRLSLKTIYRRCRRYEESGGSEGMRHKRMGARRLIRIPESVVLAELEDAAKED